MNHQPSLAHGNNSNRANFEINRSHLPQGSFGWLYRHLPEWRPKKNAQLELEALAKSMRVASRPDGALPAGYTYFAQLIDHDLTFDPSSLSQQIDDPESLHHYRTPAFDLDCIYGRGPRIDCLYYSESEPERFVLGRHPTSFELDLPRLAGRAVIADNRNDDFIILSQLHATFMKFHNTLVDHLQAHPEVKDITCPRRRSELVFHTARKLVRWHYQWVVLFDFLPKILHEEIWKRLHLRIRACSESRDRAQLTHYRPENSPYLPVEFTAAAFRFAHSLPRTSYNLNDALTKDLIDTILAFRQDDRFSRIVRDLDGPRSGDIVRLGFICDQLKSGSLPAFANTKSMTFSGIDIRLLASVQPDLRGRRPLPANWQVDWDLFLEHGGAKKVQRAMKIGPYFSEPFFDIPIGPSGHSLALLDLNKGFAQRLPSGQTLARRMGIAPRDILSEKAFPQGIEPHMKKETPLLYYILAEAAHQQNGDGLGLLGSEIVGEVLVGLILEDSTAYLNEVVHWKPNAYGDYTLHDLLNCRFDRAALDGLYLGL